jgi:dTDP-glucose 4,6-dehydratase
MDTNSFPYLNVLVTGGCGFIGSNFLNYMVPRYPCTTFYNIDCLNYCANPNNVLVSNHSNYRFIQAKLQNKDLLLQLLTSCNIDCVVHFAAQSHVDNSFVDSLLFTDDNIFATHILLECCRIYDDGAARIKRFIFISTDEVYGDSTIGSSSPHGDCKTEQCRLCPTNPYAASKAACEMLASSFCFSYRLPVIITRSNNVYGPGQYKEKLIPRFISLLKENHPCTIHGNGNFVRSFIHALDVSTALETILFRGSIGEIYNIGSADEYSVHEIADILIKHLKPNDPVVMWKIFIKDRPFNDTRYLISCEKLRALGWNQVVHFDDGLVHTIRWYLENP